MLFSVGSIIAGLLAWGIPIWRISFVRSRKIVYSTISSFGLALIALMIQFFEIANEVYTGDWAAIEDTIMAMSHLILVLKSNRGLSAIPL